MFEASKVRMLRLYKVTPAQHSVGSNKYLPSAFQEYHNTFQRFCKYASKWRKVVISDRIGFELMDRLN